MMLDPEQLAEQRRKAAPRAADRSAASAPGTADCTSPTFQATARMLAEQRAGDRTFEARRLLAIVRADRRPVDAATLRAAIATVAADDGMAEADVREHLNRALVLEDSSLAAWEQQLRRPKPRLGRGADAHQLLHGVAS